MRCPLSRGASFRDVPSGPPLYLAILQMGIHTRPLLPAGLGSPRLMPVFCRCATRPPEIEVRPFACPTGPPSEAASWPATAESNFCDTPLARGASVSGWAVWLAPLPGYPPNGYTYQAPSPIHGLGSPMPEWRNFFVVAQLDPRRIGTRPFAYPTGAPREATSWPATAESNPSCLSR